MDWDTFVTTLMATGFASGAFVFLAKILSKHLLSMDLERFKAELRANNEKELERLKADLRIAAFQQETTFAKLHEKRAEIIAELYAKLVAVHTATKLLVSPIELDGGAGRQQRNQEAMDAAREFSRYYAAHQIYLEESLCELLWRFDRDILKAWCMHGESLETGKDGLTVLKDEAWQHLEERVPPIRKEIETTFRKLIGLTPSSTTPSKTG
jgi:hypothetical protein